MPTLPGGVPVGSTGDRDPSVTPLCLGAASRPGETPRHGQGAAGAGPRAAEARAVSGVGRAAASPRRVTLSPHTARPPAGEGRSRASRS